jgi:hypothetical protein
MTNTQGLNMKHPRFAQPRQLLAGYTGIFVTGLFVIGLANATPPAVAEPQTRLALNGHGELTQVGAGTLRWFGMKIYNASLWTTSGAFADLPDSLPIALHITYQKNFDSLALAGRTAKEWERLNVFNPSQRNLWAQRLATIWPSVKHGDAITTLVTADRHTHFYYNRQLIKIIDDPEFGIALLSIWLHPATSEPGLRSALLGRQESQS